MSKFQKRVKDLLREVLGQITIKEEVNVRKLFPQYEAGNQHYDLVVPQYNLLIECHGEQHRTIQSFGKSKSKSNPMAKLMAQKRRDRRKEQIALENDWSYMVVWYDELPIDKQKAISVITEKANRAFEPQEQG